MTNPAAEAWDRAAEGWDRSTPQVHAWLRAATAAMLAQARLHPGAHVLDLAAGAGDQTRAIADAVGPAGRVLATDVSPKILDFARRNLRAAGVGNVRFEVADAQQAVRSDAPFDAVMCRLGLMFCMQPSAALASAFEALKPGGRFVALVFGEPASNPCLSIMMKVARKHRAIEAGGSPYAAGGLFSLGETGTMRRLLAAAGYVDVSVEPIAAAFELPDAGCYIDFVRASGSPIMELLAPLGAAAQQAAWDEMVSMLQQFQRPEGWRGPNELLLSRARGRTEPSMPPLCGLSAASLRPLYGLSAASLRPLYGLYAAGASPAVNVIASPFMQ